MTGRLVLVLGWIPQVDKAAFSWESSSDSSSAYMRDISFEAKPGTLTMVVGSVASGKSSLLSALIGVMERVQGTAAVGGRVAYVAQTAWIVNDSVQVNNRYRQLLPFPSWICAQCGPGRLERCPDRIRMSARCPCRRSCLVVRCQMLLTPC